MEDVRKSTARRQGRRVEESYRVREGSKERTKRVREVLCVEQEALTCRWRENVSE